jgi:UDP-glucose 4-epimerase
VRVLVTGAHAPLGAALVAALRADPAVDHVLDVGNEIDLTRPRSVHDLLYGPARKLGITAVVHAPLHASARDGGRRIHAENVETTREMLLACDGHPTIQRFVYRSAAEVYAIRSSEPNLLDEDAPLEFDPAATQWVRDRVEADLSVSARMGMSSRLSIAVLRCAEVLAAHSGSQLWDYLQSRVCFRPLGFDPMINVLSIEDAVAAVRLALGARDDGIFNIPGADTLPLSALIGLAGRIDIPVPGRLLAPLYRLRTWSVGFEFRYDLNFRRFHFGGIVDGARAATVLGYRPRHPVRWNRSAPAQPRSRLRQPRPVDDRRDRRRGGHGRTPA